MGYFTAHHSSIRRPPENSNDLITPERGGCHCEPDELKSSGTSLAEFPLHRRGSICRKESVLKEIRTSEITVALENQDGLITRDTPSGN